ncbi:efflux RND transporter periplasmic adaptor subunit [Calothrix sp. UHCC 0171]|uniref:efflux RND transporter periplasmic adaptor subunit n=1 Tax=Calothrix sp. UHCC 0171 TaxID=3110245 RepID=UPI002B21F6B0|nr:efflux RND transporter periplasmic adaptor subunit [Calothrix sp. UHCC 0171]MEA5569757.1 efflux RND transporter periplasmic adaptor subunit [Calothrix sp. UHCC 0171]
MSRLLLAAVLTAGFVIGGCASAPEEIARAQSQRRNNNQPTSGSATPVDVAIARTQPLKQQPEYTGTTVPFRVVSLRSQVQGQLLGLNADIGTNVNQGQTIGQVDEALLVTSLNQAEAELASLKSEVVRANTQIGNARAEVERLRLELVQAQADAQRQQALFKEGAIAQQAAEQSRTKAQTAAQSLRAAQAQVGNGQQAVITAQGRVVAQQALVNEAKKRRNYAKLIAPITGVITEKVSEPGNFLQPGGEVLKIGDFSRIKVVVQVSELELDKIRVGQSATVRLDAFSNQTYTGRVARISPAADATARLVPVEVEIPNTNSKIGSGLLARVNFASLESPKVTISQSAINVGRVTGANKPKQQTNSSSPSSNQPRQAQIFVVNEGEKPTVAAREVMLGESADGKVEVLSGLQPGERFVTRSGKPLKAGDSVRLSILSEKTQ